MEQPASVDFEDHKVDFSTAAEPGEVPVRLNSPSKKQLGVIAEAKLQKLNDQVRRVTGASSGGRPNMLPNGSRAYQSRQEGRSV